MRLHHVQVTCPPGGEDAARRFYADGLGLTEVPRPEGLAGRALCWFRDFDQEGRTTAEIHVGVQDPFAPALKAHPALVADDVAHLESIGSRLEELGFEITWKDRHTFDGYERFHAFDGAGNRVEVLTPIQ
ncbi:VOC family protein [Promicromonospora sp. NPDC057138]|uniref:VOC family protein n=1 Tax=Promicromonospora sp. NPDC057138 TaxID=3346031 RepID=UPI0036368344